MHAKELLVMQHISPRKTIVTECKLYCLSAQFQSIFKSKYILTHKRAPRQSTVILKSVFASSCIPEDDTRITQLRWLTLSVCVLTQRDVWRTTSWWFRFKPPWAATVNSSSGRTMPNMNSSGTPWWVSKISFLWPLRISTQPHTHTLPCTHTHTHTERWGSADFPALIFLELLIAEIFSLIFKTFTFDRF